MGGGQVRGAEQLVRPIRCEQVSGRHIHGVGHRHAPLQQDKAAGRRAGVRRSNAHFIGAQVDGGGAEAAGQAGVRVAHHPNLHHCRGGEEQRVGSGPVRQHLPPRHKLPPAHRHLRLPRRLVLPPPPLRPRLLHGADPRRGGVQRGPAPLSAGRQRLVQAAGEAAGHVGWVEVAGQRNSELEDFSKLCIKCGVCTVDFPIIVIFSFQVCIFFKQMFNCFTSSVRNL